jgi:S1-C subfamily serine protease
MNKMLLLFVLFPTCASSPPPLPPAPLSDLVKETRQSVVKIYSYRKDGNGLGSGFVVGANGHIVTAAHVVIGNTATEVVLSNGSQHFATVISADDREDVALLQINSKTNPVKFGDSDKMPVGSSIFAIGHPLGFAYSVSNGIVSAKYRHIGTNRTGDYIQVDLSTNPGNSGGPVFNYKGELVGMLTASIISPRGNSGYGLAVPSNRIAVAINRLLPKAQCQ